MEKNKKTYTTSDLIDCYSKEKAIQDKNNFGNYKQLFKGVKLSQKIHLSREQLSKMLARKIWNMFIDKIMHDMLHNHATVILRKYPLFFMKMTHLKNYNSNIKHGLVER